MAMDLEVTFMDLSTDIYQLLVGELTQWMFGSPEHPSMVARGEVIHAQKRLLVFAAFRSRFSSVINLRCTCRAFHGAKWLPTQADLGRLVIEAFEAKLLMPGKINKLITTSVDRILLDGYRRKDAALMRALGRYVTSRTPAVHNIKMTDPWFEVTTHTTPEERIAYFGREFKRQLPPRVMEIVAHAKELAAQAPAGDPPRLNIPVVAVLTRPGDPMVRTTKREPLHDVFAMDELSIYPDRFTPYTPDGRAVYFHDLRIVRHTSKSHSPLHSIVRWPRERVKGWMRNRNRVVDRQYHERLRFKERCRRLRKRSVENDAPSAEW